MRLSPLEKQALKKALEPYDTTSSFFLFGSRVNDGAKGGDIDLLVHHAGSFDTRQKLVREITIRFQKICEQKIDVLVIDPSAPTKDESLFVRTLTLQPFTLADL
jgi:predicted nucleotidyltransferase